jgi:hypothetical protein
VVAASARGRGCARRLYQDLFKQAGRAGHEHVVCEVNISPPNPASDAFHAAFGFVEVGTASVYGGSKTVRYLLRALTRRPRSEHFTGGGPELNAPEGVIRGLDPRIHQSSEQAFSHADGLPGIGERKRRRPSDGYARQ